MSKKQKLDEQLKELIKTLEETKLTPGKALDTYDLSIPYSYMFTPAAKRGMATKVQSLLHKRKLQVISTLDTEVVDKVHYFSAVAMGEEKIVKAARIITDMINDLAAKGYVTGCLAPLSYIRLCTEPHQLEQYAVFCFVSLSEEGTKIVEQDRSGYITKEGGIGPKVM